MKKNKLLKFAKNKIVSKVAESIPVVSDLHSSYVDHVNGEEEGVIDNKSKGRLYKQLITTIIGVIIIYLLKSGKIDNLQAESIQTVIDTLIGILHRD